MAARPTDGDIDSVYEIFVPRNKSVAAEYATLIDGAAEVAKALRADGVKIGSTTGYTRDIMAEITPVAARQGFEPDSLVCTGDTPDGRPTPFMLYRTLLDLGVWPAWSAVKVDDTEVGIAEGPERRRLDGRRRGQRQCLWACRLPTPRRFTSRSSSAGGRRPCSGSLRPARTMSSTASPTCCRCSTSSKAGWRAASGRRLTEPSALVVRQAHHEGCWSRLPL